MSLEDEHAKLEEDHEKLKKQYADVMGDGGSYRRLQVGLDAALQKHKDDAAAHEQALATRQTAHNALIESLKQEHAKNIEALNQQHAQNVKATIAALKEKVLGPALRAEHTRQAAELAAKQEAELKAL